MHAVFEDIGAKPYWTVLPEQPPAPFAAANAALFAWPRIICGAMSGLSYIRPVARTAHAGSAMPLHERRKDGPISPREILAE